MGAKRSDGILFAAGVFKSDASDFEIIVEDTAGNPALAAEGVERLVREQNVIGIIGPISWKESVAAGDRAQELGVLNLSLTGKEGISERGPYLFQNALDSAGASRKLSEALHCRSALPAFCHFGARQSFWR